MQVKVSTLYHLEKGPGPGAGELQGQWAERRDLVWAGNIHDLCWSFNSDSKTCWVHPHHAIQVRLLSFPLCMLLFPLHCPPQRESREDRGRKGRRGGMDNWVWPRRLGLISAGGKPSSDTFTCVSATLAGSQGGGSSSSMDALVSVSWFSVY